MSRHWVFQAKWEIIAHLHLRVSNMCLCLTSVKIYFCHTWDQLYIRNSQRSVFLPAVLTPKVIGVAIARYDFSSRDTRELSLQEGDVVKIYTKAGANGWWRGEVNGRVRLLSPYPKREQNLPRGMTVFSLLYPKFALWNFSVPFFFPSKSIHR